MLYQASTTYIEKLEKFYQDKIRQADQVRNRSMLMYMIFRAEADAIDQELKAQSVSRI